MIWHMIWEKKNKRESMTCEIWFYSYYCYVIYIKYVMIFIKILLFYDIIRVNVWISMHRE